ncbi:LysR family transcriptional regulator, hydrogen peroxide-inducible genes activator [Roseovarius marisflavi]|uniref:LysR family transcriptional regulator, hydrogen peroxide-inducible genes activator n=1 Tax=Roseovarius marisflavi TaxID=1054996 RepID=A0A1M6VIK4_9RHOB|nr:hydrogen peroxide-inducible genes activator [Roseovarius marisflavi]SHK81191.1 LysR family transcriptional regulator, hydrogen peroxide-inducible genes activator [Roseovarius marisflavi]
MNITLRQLSYFKALSEQRNFGRAAEVVSISQPALSVQIREMEAALGEKLVERRARDVVLTPFGRLILTHATRVLGEMQALTEAARWQGGLTGRLSLGIIPTIAPYILPAALEALRSRDISLDVQVREAKTDQLIQEVQTGQLDAAIVALPVAAEGLNEWLLFEDRFLLAGSAARLAALGPTAETLRPAALDQSPLLLLEDGHCLTDQALEVCGRGRGHAQIDMGASSLATLSRLVEAGFGLTLMPEIAASIEQRAAPGMHLRRFCAPEPARRIALVRRQSSQNEAWFAKLAEVLQSVGQSLIDTARAA